MASVEKDKKFRIIDSRSLENSFYKSEGNATYVLFLPDERKVLRLTKSNPEEEGCPDNGEKRVSITLNLHRNVISGLLGIFTTEPEIVICDREDLENRLKLCEHERPEKRRQKKVKETFATILPDYTLLPKDCVDEQKNSLKCEKAIFGVEIKPKEALIIESTEENYLCEFCSTRYPESNWDFSQKRYCPCDLFSGEKDRIFLALEGLLFSPRNNFRIFKNGRLVWDENLNMEELDNILEEWFDFEKSIERKRYLMMKLIYEALVRPFPESHFFSSLRDSSRTNLEKEIKNNLSQNSILGRLGFVQKIYRYDIDYISNIYNKYSDVINDEMIYFWKNEDDEDSQLTTKLSYEKKILKPNFQELNDIRNYLVYRIFRDCSIIMAFREIQSFEVPDALPENIIEISEKRFYLFKSAITDLDAKSVHCIKKHQRIECKPSIKGCFY